MSQALSSLSEAPVMSRFPSDTRTNPQTYKVKKDLNNVIFKRLQGTWYNI